MQKKITLRDIAARAGVSVFTASGAMSENPRVKESTRKEIQVLAKTMGYERDALAAAFSGRRGPRKRTHTRITIGIIEDNQAAFTPESLDAMRQRGYEPVFLKMPKVEELPHNLNAWWNQGISGLIINLTGSCDSLQVLNDAAEKKIKFPRFSVVTIGLSHFSHVRDSPVSYLEKSLKWVIAKGYQRIAVLLGSTNQARDDNARLGALLVTKERLTTPVQIEWQEYNAAPQKIPKETATWLRNYSPDALLMFPGAGFIALKKAGFKIPDDFAYCGASLPEGNPDSIAGAIHDMDENLEAAIDLMDHQLRVGQKGVPTNPTSRVIQMKLKEAPSLPNV